jgi:hypothetical protein
VGATYSVAELNVGNGAATSWVGNERADVYVPLGFQTGKALTLAANKLYVGGQIPGCIVAYSLGNVVMPPRLESPRWNSDAFRARLIGQDGQNYMIEATSDFQFWEPLGPFQTTGGIFEFEDFDAFNFDFRMYRAHAVP